MGHSKRGGFVFESSFEYDAQVDGGLCKSSHAYALAMCYFVALVEEDGPELFVGEVDK